MWRKLRTYLVSRLALFPNGPKRDILLEPGHLGVPSAPSKTISEPMVRSAQTVHLTSVKVSTISKQTENELPLEPPSPRSTIRCVQNDFRAYGTFDANRAPILRQD